MAINLHPRAPPNYQSNKSCADVYNTDVMPLKLGKDPHIYNTLKNASIPCSWPCRDHRLSAVLRPNIGDLNSLAAVFKATMDSRNLLLRGCGGHAGQL